jgi:hypothetical protein
MDEVAALREMPSVRPKPDLRSHREVDVAGDDEHLLTATMTTMGIVDKGLKAGRSGNVDLHGRKISPTTHGDAELRFRRRSRGGPRPSSERTTSLALAPQDGLLGRRGCVKGPSAVPRA